MVLQQSAGQPVAAVIDGNQKLTRQTCAEQMTDLQHMPRAFCSLHCQPDVGGGVILEVVVVVVVLVVLVLVLVLVVVVVVVEGW